MHVHFLRLNERIESARTKHIEYVSIAIARMQNKCIERAKEL